MSCSAFWCGIGAGFVTGAAVGMLAVSKQNAMKTCVGRTMQNVGTAMDSALDDLLHSAK